MGITSIDQIITEWFNGLFGANGWGTILLAVVSLLMATICAGIIGFEREYHGHAAGLRTHMLVSVGSALVMIISIYGFGKTGSTGAWGRDPARLAAQVVSGIGFLGAGTIIQTGSDVKGLTTATTLWLVMAIGLAAGSGNFIICGIATLLSVFALIGLRRVEKFASRRNPIVMIVVNPDQPVLKEILLLANHFGINVRDVESQLITINNVAYIRMNMRCSNSTSASVNAFVDEVRKTINPVEMKISTEN